MAINRQISRDGHQQLQDWVRIHCPCLCDDKWAYSSGVRSLLRIVEMELQEAMQRERRRLTTACNN